MAREQEDLKRILTKLRKKPGNDSCCDCGLARPSWASINLGIFLCDMCAGAHRNLGVHVTQVRSCTLDKWKPQWVQVMRECGNIKQNKIYAYNIPRSRMINEDTDGFTRERFIRDKYEARLWERPQSAKSRSKKSSKPRRSAGRRKRGRRRADSASSETETETESDSDSETPNTMSSTDDERSDESPPSPRRRRKSRDGRRHSRRDPSTESEEEQKPRRRRKEKERSRKESATSNRKEAPSSRRNHKKAPGSRRRGGSSAGAYADSPSLSASYNSNRAPRSNRRAESSARGSRNHKKPSKSKHRLETPKKASNFDDDFDNDDGFDFAMARLSIDAPVAPGQVNAQREAKAAAVAAHQNVANAARFDADFGAFEDAGFADPQVAHKQQQQQHGGNDLLSVMSISQTTSVSITTSHQLPSSAQQNLASNAADDFSRFEELFNGSPASLPCSPQPGVAAITNGPAAHIPGTAPSTSGSGSGKSSGQSSLSRSMQQEAQVVPSATPHGEQQQAATPVVPAPIHAHTVPASFNPVNTLPDTPNLVPDSPVVNANLASSPTADDITSDLSAVMSPGIGTPATVSTATSPGGSLLADDDGFLVPSTTTASSTPSAHTPTGAEQPPAKKSMASMSGLTDDSNQHNAQNPHNQQSAPKKGDIMSLYKRAGGGPPLGGPPLGPPLGGPPLGTAGHRPMMGSHTGGMSSHHGGSMGGGTMGGHPMMGSHHGSHHGAPPMMGGSSHPSGGMYPQQPPLGGGHPMGMGGLGPPMGGMGGPQHMNQRFPMGGAPAGYGAQAPPHNPYPMLSATNPVAPKQASLPRMGAIPAQHPQKQTPGSYAGPGRRPPIQNAAALRRRESASANKSSGDPFAGLF